MSAIKYFVDVNRNYSKVLKKNYPFFFDRPCYKEELLKRIYSSMNERSIDKVLEAGGIDRPLLVKGSGYLYNGLDIESRDKCKEIYDNFFIQSIEEPLNEEHDLIISITLLEHVKNNTASIKMMYLSLSAGGEIHHYIPSKWHPYSVALRIVGPVIQRSLIPILRPGVEEVTGYPAYFDQCSVPAMKRLLINNGFTDIDIKPFYNASDYFAFFTPIFLLVTAFENLCCKLNLSIFASGFVVSAKK